MYAPLHIPDTLGGRHFVAIFVCVATLLLSALAAFNVTVDPGGRFRGSYRAENKTAALLLEGHGAVRDFSMNEDYLNYTLATGWRIPPRAIALGSSRIGEVTADLVPVAPFFNHATGAALLDQYAGILSSYWTHGTMPKLVLIGVDPWIFSLWPDRDAASLAVFRPGLDQLAAAAEMDLKMLSVKRSQVQRWQVLSLATARTAWRTLTDNAVGSCRVQMMDSDDATACSGIRADGSHKGSRRQMEQTPTDVAAIISANMTAVNRSARIRQGLDFIENDPDQFRSFDNLIGWLASNEVRVVIVLSPFHPLAEDMLRYDPPRPESAWSRFENVETAIRAVAAKHDLVILGSYSSARAGCTAKEFVDWLHPRRSCISRIMAALRVPVGVAEEVL